MDNKKHEVDLLKKKHDIDYFKNLISPVGAPKDFTKAISRPVSLIAEVKKHSPSAGVIKGDYDPVQIAMEYEAAGASAISVLTDSKFFGGSLKDLKNAAKAVKIPVLRKEFIIDEVQIYESRANGADAVLLIARILDDTRLRRFIEISGSLGMAALVEVHSLQELKRALDTRAGIIGINNRDLDTLKIDLSMTLELKKHIPGNIVVVSESGISGHHEINKLREAGINAVLVGEALLKAENIGSAVKKLLFG